MYFSFMLAKLNEFNETSLREGKKQNVRKQVFSFSAVKDGIQSVKSLSQVDRMLEGRDPDTAVGVELRTFVIHSQRGSMCEFDQTEEKVSSTGTDFLTEGRSS